MGLESGLADNILFNKWKFSLCLLAPQLAGPLSRYLQVWGRPARNQTNYGRRRYPAETVTSASTKNRVNAGIFRRFQSRAC